MSYNTFILLLAALAAGAMMPTQAATNNKMAIVLDSPILAALVSFFVGTVLLLIYAVASGASLESLTSVKDAPPVAWLGGLFGACFVTAAVMLVPRIGVAMTFTMFVAGQMLISLVFDHFGLLGVPVKEVSLTRIGGAMLITAGVVLIQKY